MIDWKVRLEERLGKKVVELTGDVAPDMKMVADSDVIGKTILTNSTKNKNKE
jgi:activating signal cointegrator complex subunit 3